MVWNIAHVWCDVTSTDGAEMTWKEKVFLSIFGFEWLYINNNIYYKKYLQNFWDQNFCSRQHFSACMYTLYHHIYHYLLFFIIIFWDGPLPQSTGSGSFHIIKVLIIKCVVYISCKNEFWKIKYCPLSIKTLLILLLYIALFTTCTIIIIILKKRDHL